MTLLLAFLASISVFATDINVTNQAEMSAAVSLAKPGDSIIIQDGTYTDFIINTNYKLHAKADARITIKPQTKHAVIFKGKTSINLRANYWTFDGFKFEDSRENSVSVRGSNVIFSNNFFERCGHPKNTQATCVNISGDEAQVFENEFTGSKSMSIRFENATAPHIHHNYWHDIVKLSNNGQESLQIQGADVKALVEHNRFLRTSGDPEAVSIKSSGNMIRYNLLRDCGCEISLRAGSNNTVIGNVLINTRYGIRVAGSNHTIMNNYIEKPREGTAIYLQFGRVKMNGENEQQHYRAVTDSKIEGNTFISDKVGVQFGNIFDRGVSFQPTSGNVIKGNKFIFPNETAKFTASTKHYTLDSQMAANMFSDNLIWFGTETMPRVQ